MYFDLAHVDYSYSPLEGIFIFCMVLILVFIISHLSENIYRFFRIRKGLRLLKNHLDTQGCSSLPGTVSQDKRKAKKKKSPVLKFISDTIAAFEKLKSGMKHPWRYQGVMNHLTHKNQRLFLKNNLFIFLAVLSVFFGALVFIISLNTAFHCFYNSLGPLDNSSALTLGYLFAGLFEGIIHSIGLQILTLIVSTTSVLAHLISKNIVKAISREIAKIEI